LNNNTPTHPIVVFSENFGDSSTSLNFEPTDPMNASAAFRSVAARAVSLPVVVRVISVGVVTHAPSRIG